MCSIFVQYHCWLREAKSKVAKASLFIRSVYAVDQFLQKYPFDQGKSFGNVCIRNHIQMGNDCSFRTIETYEPYVRHERNSDIQLPVLSPQTVEI